MPVLLNSTFFCFLRELGGFTALGDGVHKMPVYEVNAIILPRDLLRIEKININLKRPQESIFEEIGINSSIPIREQEPKPLPDRKELDDIVFDSIGLTIEERKEVYWAVCELVRNRLG
jgi:hypothetical protein